MKKSLLIIHLFSFAWLALVGEASLASEGVGKADAGQRISAMCMGCHGISGYRSSYPEVYRVPLIAGQNAKYLISALSQYKNGERKHPSMRAIAQSLSEQDMADLAAFYSQAVGAMPAMDGVAATQEAKPGAQALIKNGNCVSCHGANFSAPIDPSYPKLAGQYPDYLMMALRAYVATDNPVWGRAHATMSSTLKAVQTGSDSRQFEQQLREVASYLAGLPSELKVLSAPILR